MQSCELSQIGRSGIKIYAYSQGMIIYVIYYRGKLCSNFAVPPVGTQRLNHLTLLFSIPHGENGLWHSLLLHPPH
jgi:hypothetical protein